MIKQYWHVLTTANTDQGRSTQVLALELFRNLANFDNVGKISLSGSCKKSIYQKRKP